VGRLIEDINLRDKVHVFRDRADAGKQLAQKLAGFKSADAIIFAIPAGGVPVAYEIADNLKLPLDVLIVRKIQIPGNTEAGFGAMGPDGEVILNERILNSLFLTQDAINRQIDRTRKVLDMRNKLFRGKRAFPGLLNKTVIIADDGLASGYTMSEAVRFAKRKKTKRIVIAVPTGSESAVSLLLNEVDELYCLNIRGLPFAVAEAYKDWYDVGDDEVIRLLKDGKIGRQSFQKSPFSFFSI
jgi:putative phosphoribosyl transferase